MKDWFPFTDYDFYAYLTAGFGLLFAIDLVAWDGAIFLRESWPAAQIIFAVGLAYIVGQLLAAPSSTVLEHWIARSLLYPPVTVLLSLKTPRRREKFVGGKLVGRNYEPLPEKVRTKILAAAAEKLQVAPADLTDPEEIFQIAFPVAQSMPEIAARLDQFLKLYGLSRNIAFVALIDSILFAWKAISDGEAHFWSYTGASLLIFAGSLIRFLKFYSAYGSEVIRAYFSKA